MDVKQEIVARVDKLPPELQEQVLRFVTSLSMRTPQGKSGASLLQFAGSLDAESAQQMKAAVEEACEQIDAGQW